MGRGIVFQVLYAIACIAGVDEVACLSLGGTTVVGRGLHEGLGVLVERVEAVLEQYLVVIVGAGGVAVDAVSDIEHAWSVGRAKLRAEADAIHA